MMMMMPPVEASGPLAILKTLAAVSNILTKNKFVKF